MLVEYRVSSIEYRALAIHDSRFVICDLRFVGRPLVFGRPPQHIRYGPQLPPFLISVKYATVVSGQCTGAQVTYALVLTEINRTTAKNAPILASKSLSNRFHCSALVLPLLAHNAEPSVSILRNSQIYLYLIRQRHTKNFIFFMGRADKYNINGGRNRASCLVDRLTKNDGRDGGL